MRGGNDQARYSRPHAEDVLDGRGIAHALATGRFLSRVGIDSGLLLMPASAVADLDLYVDIFLGAVYPMGGGRMITIVPTGGDFSAAD